MHFKLYDIPPLFWRKPFAKTLLVMKLTAFLLLVTCLQTVGRGYSQTITLTLKNKPLQAVFKEVEKQTGYTFIYTRELLVNTVTVTIEAKSASLQQVLNDCFREQPITYIIEGRFIVIKNKKVVAPPVVAVATVAESASGTISIRVVGEIGEPLAGASVHFRQLDKLKSMGITNEKGEYRVPDLENGVYTLEVTFIGYERVVKEITVPDKVANHLIVLKKSVSVLDEVQTIAYSKTSLRYNTGDITTITSQEIAKVPVPNVLQALQGRVAGMFVNEVSGQVNGAFQVQIRSLNTLSGGAKPTPGSFQQGGQPLYIVDGVEYPASSSLPLSNLPGISNFESGGNALNYLDPSLIESINVLKGADATAIYGSRGAFGVILITTKKAKAGRHSVNINGSYGFSTVGKMPTLMNKGQYLDLRRNALANDNLTPGITDYDLNGTWDTTQSTDLKKFFMDSHAPVMKLNASYSGGSSNTSFLLGAQYNTIGNIQRSKGSVRSGGMNFSMNTATNDRKFTTTFTGSYTNNLNDMVPVDFAGSGLYTAPSSPYPLLPDGKLNWVNGTNPAAALNAIYRNSTDNLVANAVLNYTPLKGLTFTASGGFNLLTGKEFNALPSSYFNPATFTPAQTYSSVNLYRIRTYSADPRVEYTRLLWDKGRLSLTAGGTLVDVLTQKNSFTGSGIPIDALLNNPALANSANAGITYTLSPKRYIGGFAILNFRWADKYILSVNGRRDGSSVFGNDKQFGNFWSVATGWIISDEPWFKGLRGFIDFLKLKASIGLVGGSAIAPYAYINTYGFSSNSYGGGIGLSPQNLANPYLHWETNRNREVGLTVDLLKGRVNIDAIYYFNTVGDQLISQPLAGTTGFSSFTNNTQAQIRTYGSELTLNTKNINNTNFIWSTRINVTLPRTKLMSYPGVDNLVSNVNYVIGKPITGVKLFNYAGVDPATGVYHFINADGVKGDFNPLVSPVFINNLKDRTEFINLAPKYYGGILNTFTYKNLSLDFLVSVTNRMGPSYLAFQSYAPGTFNVNFPVDIANKRWMKPGDMASVRKATVNDFSNQNYFVNSTGGYTDATYARLQNLSIAYRLPGRLLKRARMSTLSMYAAGQNLYTISKFKNLDPENMLASRMPPLRTYTIGLTLTY
jgi:TonB-linked SusC/RagA family outer membrane protein